MKHRGEIELIARGLLVDAGHVLVCCSNGASNTYLPGGHIEFGERAVDALQRELVEETGVRVHVGPFLAVVENIFEQGGERHGEINLVFAMHSDALSSSAPVISRESDLAFSWQAPGRLHECRIEPAILCRLIPQWLDDSQDKPRWASHCDPGPGT